MRHYNKYWDCGGDNFLRFETTVQRPVEASGVGLHTGVPVHIRILPAPPSTGIVFIRTDLDGFTIPASWRYVQKVSYATSLMRQGVLISTTEHLLSVFYSMSIDNAFVEIDNLEVPILDGSGQPFVELIRAAGIKQFRRTAALSCASAGRFRWKAAASASPFCPRTASCSPATCSYDHPLVGRQVLEMEVTPERYAAELAPARTFGFEYELDQMRNMGLIRGASLENAVCFDRRVDSESRRPAFRGRMLPAQGAGSDRRSGADRQAAAGARDRGTRRPRDAFRAGEPHHVRPDAVRDPELRSVGHARRARAGVLAVIPA